MPTKSKQKTTAKRQRRENREQTAGALFILFLIAAVLPPSLTVINHVVAVIIQLLGVCGVVATTVFLSKSAHQKD